MIPLDNVTLVAVSCTDLPETLVAINICEQSFRFGDKKIFSSMNHPDVIPINRIESVYEYSKFCIKGMNQYIETDYIMLVQYDGFILNPSAWNPAFLDYDYIGAPFCYTDSFIVGNGGFCIRSKKLLEALQDDEIFIYHPEDQQICRTYRPYLENEHGIKFAPAELARKFSIEGISIHAKERYHPNADYNKTNKWNGQFGFHGLGVTDISEWIKNNPQAGIENNLIRRHIW
jgi:hypothetical protein